MQRGEGGTNASLLLSDPVMSAKWKQIYDEHKFPFEVRYHLDEWINQIPWDEIRKDREVDTHSQTLIRELYKEIQKKINDPQLGPLEKMYLNTAETNIKERFNNQPVDLIEVIQNCLNQERLLIDSSKKDTGDRHQTEEDVDLQQYAQMEEQIKKEGSSLSDISQNADMLLEQLHTTLDQAIPRLSDLQDKIRDCREKQQFQTEPRELQRIQTDFTNACTQMKHIFHVVNTKKMNLKDTLYLGCQTTVQILMKCWKAIEHYQQQQKHLVCFLAKPPEGAIDSLHKICEIGGKYLMDFIGYLDIAIRGVARLEEKSEPVQPTLMKLRDEMGHFLAKHMKSIFVITRQPQNVIKIVQNKSPQLHMCVRLLGGTSLGIGHTVPYVTVRVYNEQKLKQAMEVEGPTVEGVCKTVENGSDVPMSLKKPKDHIQANINNMVLRGVERFEKKDKDERVTDYKFGIICYTRVTVRNKEYPLKVLSLPIVFTSQTSQEGPAKGTLLWDALSPLDRNVYEDPSTIQWDTMKQVLKGFYKETGLGLNEEQIDYIRRYIFGNGVALGQDENQTLLSKERFLRDKVRGCDFTYWMWLFACKNLIMEFVHAEWKDRMIYGFIGRVEAEMLLKDQNPGTFLLRFRERKIEGSQKANKCAYLALAVVGWDSNTGEKMVDHVKDYLTPNDIQKYGLTRILQSMVDVLTKQPLLKSLYPNTDFKEIVDRYIPDKGDSSEGYSRTEFMIRVMNRRPLADGSDCPLSPASTISSNVTSPGIPPDNLTTLDFETADLLFSNDSFMSTCENQISTINFNDLPISQAGLRSSMHAPSITLSGDVSTNPTGNNIQTLILLTDDLTSDSMNRPISSSS